ncbi:MAG: hypothetical protein HKN74_10515 [Acidimicrobiia bacterium]|nr:hypothetical protein [Acidimicrobiia bacterium]
MSQYLPHQFRPQCTPLLAKKMLVCVAVVACETIWNVLADAIDGPLTGSPRADPVRAYLLVLVAAFLPDTALIEGWLQTLVYRCQELSSPLTV